MANKLTKAEAYILALVVRNGEASLHYRRDENEVLAARSLVKKGLLSCPCPSADWERFLPTRAGTRRMLHGVA